MKKLILSSLMFVAFMLVSTGSPFQLLHIDSVKTAYASGQQRITSTRSVPEPTTLALLAVGGAGVGLFGFIRRRNRK
jgi:hypothetical protein